MTDFICKVKVTMFDRSSSRTNQLTKDDFDRLNQLVFEQIEKFSIVYPNKTQRETQKISAEVCRREKFFWRKKSFVFIFSKIIENWERFEPLISRFWFAD